MVRKALTEVSLCSFIALSVRCHSGMVRKDQTRNLEIPGSMLAHRPGMTWANKRGRPGHSFALSRRDACVNLRPSEGVGNAAGCPMHPQPLCRKKHRGRRRRFTGITRHSRTRMVLTAYIALL